MPKKLANMAATIYVPSMFSRQKAFSMVELSIVLVILGLLVGGILAGKSLIRAAELRSVSTEYKRYITAAQAFRDKYFYLPGDLPNATAIWGAASTCPGDPTHIGTGTQTCNGNGDSAVYPNAASNESYRFWQQLANAGLIEGSYSGVTQGTSNSYTSTTDNSPNSKIGGLWFEWNYTTQSGGALNMFDGSYDNVLELGGYAQDNYPAVAIMTPEELWNIDTKLDDGMPATGKFVVRGLSCTTASDSTSLSASYALNSATPSCKLIVRKVF